MNSVVTAGPTYEKLDNVRRLTNFSTGRLGSELAEFLAGRGHRVRLLLGEQATYRAEHARLSPEVFTTTADLRDRLKRISRERVDAVFHVAAVSDFTFGQVWVRAKSDQELTPVKEGKISTRQGTLLAELLPTPKIIANLREWYPNSVLVGWKYEVEGTTATVVKLAEQQMIDCRTTACVANGPGYGEGFGLVTGIGRHAHFENTSALFPALDALLASDGK